MDKTTITKLKNNFTGFLKIKTEVIQSLKNIKKSEYIRKDYQELADLTLIVLGEPHNNYLFKSPGGLSNARWMAKAIYGLKCFIFQKELDLDQKQIEKLEVFVKFITLVYVREWLITPLAIEAANSDLRFLRNVKKFSSINKPLSKLVLEKYSRQSWYLSGELMGFSLFSNEVTSDEKSLIVEKMKNINPSWEARSLKAQKSNLTSKNLCDYVDSTTICVLRSLGIKIDELIEADPKDWESLGSYNEGNWLFCILWLNKIF